MARVQLNTVVRHIRFVIGARQCRDTTDNDLVQRFAARRDEAAFAGLLQRHGPMVLGVCRRVLHNAADADDAFQATFLVLVRKAGSIRKTASVGSWLHGVAFRVAREAKVRTEKQRPGETPDITGHEPDPSAEAARRELCSILDQELAHLPAKYRSPLVLHYLEGKTKEETARELGWTEGTVSGRLARARESLRKRLAGRNVSFSSGMMAVLLSEQAATTPVPAALTNATMQSALLLGAGGLAADAGAGASHTLAEAVLKSMLMSKLKHTIPLAIVLLVATVGLAVGGQRLLPPAKSPPLPADKPKDPDVGLSKQELEERFGKELEAKRFAFERDGAPASAGLFDKAEFYNDLSDNGVRRIQAQLDTKTGQWTVKWARSEYKIVGDVRIGIGGDGQLHKTADWYVRKWPCTSVVCFKPDQGWRKVSFEESPPGDWVKGIK
jgi:RNA polymerase sigma factor (sigma-70 family)